MKKEIIGYIHIKDLNKDISTVEVYLDGVLRASYKMKDFNILDEIKLSEKADILEAVDTAKVLREYKSKNNIELWDSEVVVMKS